MTSAKRRKKTNDQTEGSEKNQMTITAMPAGEAFVKQRCFKLAIALKIADRKGEDFIADNAADGEVDLTTANGGAVEEKEKVDLATAVNEASDVRPNILSIASFIA